MFVCRMHPLCLQRPEEAVGSLGIEVTACCELSHGCWEPNLGPLTEQKVLLTSGPLNAAGFIKSFGFGGRTHRTVSVLRTVPPASLL